nr:heme-binding protein 2-like [Ciona intestinalis]|eukprot:XP_002120166.1 heme-binding protein 2-like [Ciona intestinalis]
MISTFVVTVLFLSAATAKQYNSYEEPEWRLIGDQPKDGSFEARLYPACNWTTTSIRGDTVDQVTKTAFWRLFKYIQGANIRKTVIPMTVPVSIRTPSQPCPFCPTEFDISFYLPTAFQTNQPEPTNSLITVREQPAMKVYARTFTGFADSVAWKTEAGKLYADLLRNGVSDSTLDKRMMICAGYDSPFHLFNRRNEVWIAVKPQA